MHLTRLVSRFISLAILAIPSLCRGQAIVTIVAGNGTQGFLGDGGPATKAELGITTGVAVDAAGNIYIADSTNGRIRKVNAAGIINTIAGSPGNGGYVSGGGGPATSAILSTPQSVAVDSAGNIYIADTGVNRIRKIDTSGIINTVAGGAMVGGSFGGDGGPATGATLSVPRGVAVDNAGNIYIADTLNNRVRKVNTSGIINTIAGNGSGLVSGDGGPAVNAGVSSPENISIDNAGNLYIAGATRIRKVDTNGVITTVAGSSTVNYFNNGDGGPATSATIYGTNGVGVDSAGNVYLSDQNEIRVVKNGIISSFAKPPNQLTYQLALDASGDVFVANDGVIIKIAVPVAAPSISANGVQNGASFLAGVVPGSWATIKGSNLAQVTDNWSNSIVNGTLPTTLDNVKITIGGQPAYIYYVSPAQINFLVPNIPAGPAQVTVTTSGGTSPAVTTTSSLYAPAFFPWPNNQAVATHQDYTLAADNGTFTGATTVPAKPGEVIVLWGTGLGPTTPAAPQGVEVPGDQVYATSTMPTVTINNVSALVYGAALTAGDAGLYQVAIQVPPSLANGDWPIVQSIGGQSSPSGIVLGVHQ